MNGSEQNYEVPNVFLFYEMVWNGIPNIFIFRRMARIGIPSVFRSAKQKEIWRDKSKFPSFQCSSELQYFMATQEAAAFTWTQNSFAETFPNDKKHTNSISFAR
jgi:hypothetical protein